VKKKKKVRPQPAEIQGHPPPDDGGKPPKRSQQSKRDHGETVQGHDLVEMFGRQEIQEARLLYPHGEAEDPHDDEHDEGKRHADQGEAEHTPIVVGQGGVICAIRH